MLSRVACRGSVVAAWASMCRRLLAVLGSALALGACTYEGHYTSGTYAGAATYTASLSGTPSGANAAGTLVVDVTDDVATNQYNEPVSGNVTIALGPLCTLTASYQSIQASHGDVLGVTSTINDGQTCTLSVGGVTAAFAVVNGLAVTNGRTIDVTVSGAVSTWNGTPTTGFVAFEFHGTR